MKKLYSTIGKIIFYLFVVAVFAWTASLTLGEMKQILPNDPITPYFALALFDIGALAWLMAWQGHARGLMQRSISAIMLILDLAGVVLLSAGRLLAGGQTMTDIPASLSAAVIYGVVFATLANLAAIYAFHITDPDTMAEIETGLLSDTLRDEAMKQATANIEAEAQQLGAIMAARATGQLKYNLRLPMSERESAQVIDAQAQDITEPKAAQQQKKSEPNLITRWIRNTARKVRTVPASQAVPVMVPMQATTAAPGNLYDAMKQGIAEAQGVTPDKLYSPADGVARVLSQTEATPETKQAVNAAARTAWLYDNSNTAPADESNHGPALDDTNPTGRQLTGA